jgi:hypothetical protein
VADDYPQVVDKSTLTGVFQADQFLGIGVEGAAVAGATATIAVPYVVTSGDQANTLFGATSPLAKLCNLILGRGIGYVTAVASVLTGTPTLVQRQTAWTPLEENDTIRIRLTDSMVQADLVGLARSCEWAEGIQRKQFCCVGLASPSTKATAITAAGAILSKRAVLWSPCVYDTNGVLMTGSSTAALAASVIAQNPDIADSLNNAGINATAGIEKDAATMPLYRLHAGAGTPVNDFQDLLTVGISPLKQDGSGLAAFTHIRTTWTTDTTFDALTTLLIKDEVFIQLRNALVAAGLLRMPNTLSSRAFAAKIVDSWLKAHSDWVAPVALPNGETGYGVTTVPSVDLKSFTVNYKGQVVRGTNVININGTLTIPA